MKLEFTWDTDMNIATSDVREKLDQVFLPEEVKRPLILRYDPSLDPIMRLGLYGKASLFYMRYLAEEELKRILETVEGVAAVKVKGGLEEEIRVELDEQKLTLIGIDIQQGLLRLFRLVLLFLSVDVIEINAGQDKGGHKVDNGRFIFQRDFLRYRERRCHLAI